MEQGKKNVLVVDTLITKSMKKFILIFHRGDEGFFCSECGFCKYFHYEVNLNAKVGHLVE